MKDEKNRGQSPGAQGGDHRNEEQRNSRETAAGGANEPTPIYLTPDSTLQSPEEHAHDQSIDPRKDDTMDVSDTDLEEIKAGKLTGREPRSGEERGE